MFEKPKSILMLSAIFFTYFMIAQTATRYNMLSLNRIRFGDNPFVYNHILQEGQNEMPKVPIFEFGYDYTNQHSCDNRAEKIPDVDQLHSWCEDSELVSTYVIDSSNYMEALNFVSQVEDGELLSEKRIFQRYGAYNTKVQDLYSNLIKGQRYRVNVFKQNHVTFTTPPQPGPPRFTCNFFYDIMSLEAQPGATYTDFIERYGIYFRDELKMGGYYQIWTALDDDLDDGEAFVSQSNFSNSVHDPQDVLLASGNPLYLLNREPIQSFNTWDRTSDHLMVITQQYLVPMQNVIDFFTNFGPINRVDGEIILENFQNTVNTYIDDVGRLWLDPTIVENPSNHQEFVVSVAFESGKVLSAQGPALFENNGEKIVDIAITSKWLAYINIIHDNPTHNFSKGNAVNQKEYAGTKTELDSSLSFITGLQFIDNWGSREDCLEIQFLVNDVWYNSCEPNNFPEGITKFQIFDQSGW